MEQIKQAIIVAAGLGSRLRPYTDSLPKGLLEIGTESLLERNVRLMLGQGIEEIAVVVGYRQEMIRDALGGYPISFISNPFYKLMNNMGSLWFAHEFIQGPFIYSHSDIIYDPALMAQLANAEHADGLLVEAKLCGEEEMKVQAEHGILVASSKEIQAENSLGEWTGMARFSKNLGELLMDKIGILIEAGHQMEYDTFAFSQLAQEGQPCPLIYRDAVARDRYGRRFAACAHTFRLTVPNHYIDSPSRGVIYEISRHRWRRIHRFEYCPASHQAGSRSRHSG